MYLLVYTSLFIYIEATPTLLLCILVTTKNMLFVANIKHETVEFNILVLCKCIYNMQTEALLGLWTMCFMYVCFPSWSGRCTDKKVSHYLQKSLSCDSSALGSHMAGKVSQVHPLLLAMINPF